MTEDELHTDSEELGTGETGEELAPSNEEPVKAPEGFIKAEDAQKDINRQHKKFRDEERARRKIEADYESTRKELDELRHKAEAVTVPPPPDPYADNYEDAIRQRDDALTRKITQDAQLQNAENERVRAEQDRAAQQEQAVQEKVATFDANMVQIGLNPMEVKKSADKLIEYETSDLVQDVLLEDTEGALLVTYLANNPIELDQLNGMSALQLVRHLDEKVRPKAALLRPQTSQAPDPPETLSGGGVTEIQDPLLAGATFE